MGITAESDRLHLLLVVVAAGMLALGCADGTSLQSPAGPSDVLNITTLQANDDTDPVAFASQSGESGTLDKGGRGNGGEKKGNDEDGDGQRGRSHDDKVVGFVTAKDGDTLTVRGVSVVAGSDAIIRHGHRTLTMSDIAVGDHVEARGAMDGSKLVATEIKVQNTRRHGNGDDDDDDDDDADDDDVEGVVSNLSSTSNCPAVTFNIGSTKVTTSSSTSYDEVTCATLANGIRVEVEGTKQGDGTIAAARVERK